MDAQKLFDNAVYYERRRNWAKTIQCYGNLLQRLKEERFKTLCPTAQDKLDILKFQCYFHCAIAHQKLCDHEQAILALNQSIKSLQKTKNNFRGGCIRGGNIHWCVPAYARKSFSEIYLGRLNEAHKSAESALVLDYSNPDILCIRALVRYFSIEKEKAITDVSQAIKMNSSHVCALLLRSLFKKQNKNSGALSLTKDNEWSKDEEKACDINPSVVTYFGCDIKDKFIEIFERYLPTIRCSHTVTVYDVLQTTETKTKPKTKKISQKTGTSVSTSTQRSCPTRKISITSTYTGQGSSNGFPSEITGDSDTEPRIKDKFVESHNPSSEMENGSRTLKLKPQVSQTECCENCSSLDGFLKNLIHGEKNSTKTPKMGDSTKRKKEKTDYSETVRMYPRPWAVDQDFMTLPPNFSTSHLRKTK